MMKNTAPSGSSLTNPREATWKILSQSEKKSAWIEDRLEAFLQPSEMTAVDQRLCRELCFGTVKMQAFCDHVLSPFLKQPAKTPEAVRWLLRMGVYQLLCLDKVPAHAAVHETVDVAKKKLPNGQVKMVNAVLRSVIRQGDPKLPDPEQDPVSYLAVRHSFPKYIAKRWWSRYGMAATEDIMRQANAAPVLTARINPLANQLEQVVDQLREHHVQTEPGLVTNAIVIRKTPLPPAQLIKLNPSAFYFQDQASQLVGWLVDPPSAGTCLDVCAAPGGKTTHLAELMANQGCVQAYDVSVKKRNGIRENAKRLGLTNIVVLEDLQHVRPSDRVLVDAPCSGLGTLRRHVETRWRLTEQDHARLATTQGQLLKQAAEWVKPGGHLIYATCTTEPEENEDVVRKFLDHHTMFRIQPGPGQSGHPDAAYWDGQGFFRTFPNPTGMDAMFACRMQRKS